MCADSPRRTTSSFCANLRHLRMCFCPPECRARFRASLLLTLVALSAVGYRAGAQAAARVISGTVVDTAGNPIVYANIGVTGATRSASDDSGRFRVHVSPNARLDIEVRRIGFAPVDLKLAPGGDTSLTIAMFQIARTLKGLRIEAERLFRSLEFHGFYRRMQDREKGMNAGQFITAEDIERRKPYRVSHMLEGLHGVRLRQMKMGSWVPLGLSGCPMAVYLDRVRINLDRVRMNSLAGGEAVEIDELVGPTTVAGMEVYSTAVRAPPAYQTMNSGCGVLLIWTK